MKTSCLFTVAVEANVINQSLATHVKLNEFSVTKAMKNEWCVIDEID